MGSREVTVPLRHQRFIDLGSKGVTVQAIARRFGESHHNRIRKVLRAAGIEPVEEKKFVRSPRADRLGASGGRKGRQVPNT